MEMVNVALELDDIYSVQICSCNLILSEGRIWDSSNSIVTVFNSWQRQGVFLFATSSTLALGPTKPSVQ